MMTNSLKYYLSIQKERLNDIQTITSTQKKVNKPSDSPVAAGQILNDRISISRTGQYQSNITQAQTWIKADNNVLDTAYSLLDDAENILVDQSSSNTEDNRNDMITTLTGYYDQIVDYADTTYSNGEYLYSGDRTTSKPFADETAVSGGAAQDLSFDLASAASTVNIKITNQSGEVVRNMTLTSGVAGTNTVAWDGLNDSGVAVADGTYNYTISAADSSGAAVASYCTYRGADGEKAVIIGENKTVDLNKNGGAIFSPALKALSEAITALKTEPFDTAGLTTPLADLKAAMSTMKKEMNDVAAKNDRITAVNDSLSQALVYYQNQLSDVETADLDQASVELQAQETNYTATINTISSIQKLEGLITHLS
ncbi:MAG: flagellar hook-associated protein FlgL [Deltaproteobacteria bacterium]|nr:flagellar hook-associated protein FlgL [Deltaproteobacteria bacterium]